MRSFSGELINVMFSTSSCGPQYLFQQQSGQFRVGVLQRLHLLDQIVSCGG